MKDNSYIIDSKQFDPNRKYKWDKLVLRKRGKQIGKLLIFDLLRHNIGSRFGIYVILHNGKSIYIGKNSSRAFIERVPAHFDFGGKDRWLSTVTKRLYKIMKNEAKMWKYISNCSIVFIPMRSDNMDKTSKHERKDIGNLETQLIKQLKPCLNNPHLSLCKLNDLI